MEGFTPCLTSLAIAWLIYFVVHSLLAAINIKQRVVRHYPALMPYYRVSYNLVALLMLGWPLWLMVTCESPQVWRWLGYWQLFSWAMVVVALLIFFWTTRYYDGSAFLGLRQIREDIRTVTDQEQFQLSPVHRFVRHPWYFVGLLLVWSRDMNQAYLLSAVLITLYFFIGSRLEEQKLMTYHGEVYRRYLKAVPGIIPLPWKYLTARQAEELGNQ